MNPNQSNETLILREKNFSLRIFGVLFIFIGIGLIAFYWVAPKIFSKMDALTLNILSLIVLIFGIVLLIVSFVMLLIKDRELIFDNHLQKFYFTTKGFFRKKSEEHFYHEIIDFAQEITEMEDNTFFDNFIILPNSKVTIPSQHKTDKDLQDRQLQQIKEFINFQTSH